MASEPTRGRVGYILDLLGYNNGFTVKEIADSEIINRMWEEQIYAYVSPGSSSTVAVFTNGDLRQRASVYKSRFSDLSYIEKLGTYYVSIYRTGILYLRFAEAVNFAGKPALAFAVLKYGLKKEILDSRSLIPPHELETGYEYINIFENEVFNENIGIHSRGSGRTDLNTSYVIPSGLQNRMDSIESVSGFILTELALETAFEGNRFHDLMRFSWHLDNNNILADAVALKHVGKELQIKAYLSDSRNWYLPLPDNKNE